MRRNVLIPALVWVLVLVATASGLFYRTNEPRIGHLTVRGEHAVFQGSGLYRFDPAVLAREGIIWDVINLAIGLPLLAAAIYLSARGSLRGRLLLAGLLSYFFYVYLMYATMMAFNPLFIVYVAIFALSGVGFFINLSSIDVAGLPQKMGPRFPRRVFAVFSLVVGAMLVFLWMGRIVPMTISNAFPPELAGLSTLEPQALDLGLLVPLALASGILLLRRSPWGYFLIAVMITHGFMMFISVPSWIVVPLIQDGAVNAFEASPFLLVSLLGLFLTVWFYRNVPGRSAAAAAQPEQRRI